MIDHFIKGIVGRKLSDLYGAFFFEGKDSFQKPMSIYIPDKKGNYIALVSNGCGRARKIEIFSDIYYAEEIGFSVVAPLMIIFNKENIFDSVICEVTTYQEPASEWVRIVTAAGNKIVFRFEDDDLFLLLNENK